MAKNNALTEIKIKNAKPKTKPYKLVDGDGLYLLVHNSGGKWWRFRYRFDQKEKEISIGTYPEITLREAREKRFEFRNQKANGFDPAAIRKIKKDENLDADNTFEAVAREWYGTFRPAWTDKHAHTIISRLERDVFPIVGNRPMVGIEPPDILALLRRIETRGANETAHRIRSICGQVFRYAVATGRAKRDQTADLKGALAPVVKQHRAAITEPAKIGELLRAIEGYHGHFIVRCAIRLAPLVFVRPGELRHAEWAEINLDEAVWNIPAKKMKMKQTHLVPLSKQAVDILREVQTFTGMGKYVFPSGRTFARPMSENAILAALRRMGYAKEEMTGHGFRAMARTILDEVLQIRPDFIEHQLAHAVRDPLGRAYNRTAHLAERRKMMQQWADYLDKVKMNL